MNYEVDYVGNPSVDSVSNYQMRESVGRSTFFRMNRLADKPILALLAGSRKQEIRDNLPVMLRVAARFPEYQPVIAELRELIRNITGNIPIRLYRFCFSRPIRSCSIATWLSLHPERLRSRLPCSVFRRWFATTCGRTPRYLYFQAFFHTPYISLVNLIAGKEVVQELFGERFSEEIITTELKRIIHDKTYRETMLQNYDEMIRILGKPGASIRTAELIVKRIKH